jgi:hypothetical protein
MEITTSTTTLDRLRNEWETAVLRGRPDRFAKQKEYLAAKVAG